MVIGGIQFIVYLSLPDHWRCSAKHLCWRLCIGGVGGAVFKLAILISLLT